MSDKKEFLDEVKETLQTEIPDDEIGRKIKDSINESLTVYSNQSCGSDGRSKEAANVARIIESYTKFASMESDREDKIERRRIEEEKNKINAEIESEKARIPWEKISVEILASFGRGLMDHLFFGLRQKEILSFEETGTIRSKASRDVTFHFPWSKK